MKTKMFHIIIVAFVLLAAYYLITGFYPAKESGVYYTDEVAVLMYHHIDETENGAVITVQRFTEHMDMLVEKGYQVISMEQCIAFVNGEGEVPPNAVVLTFDDGYESFYTYAAPVLQERAMTATVFMIVRHIGVKEGQIPKLDWQQIEALEAVGMSFHSHSYDSHFYHQTDQGGSSQDAALASKAYRSDLGRLESQQEYEKRVYEDLTASKKGLDDNLSNATDVFSAPYGRKNKTVDQLARDAGFHYIFTIEKGRVSRESDPLALPRINAGSPKIDAETLHRTLITTR